MGLSSILTLAAAGSLVLYSRLRAPISAVVFYPLLILIALCKPLYYYQIYPFYISPLRRLPAPKQKPYLFYGHFPYNTAKADGSQMVEWARENKGSDLMIKFAIANSERLVPVPRAMHEVLQSKCYTYVKPPFISVMLKAVAGDGLLLAEGDLHKHQRKLLMPAFSFHHINTLVPVITDEARRLVDVYRQRIALASDGKSDSGTIDVNESLSSITLDVIYRAGLGLSFNALEDPHNELSTAYRTVFAATGVADQFMMLCQTMIPGFKYIPIPSNIKLQQARQVIWKFANDAIEAKLRKFQNRDMSEKLNDSEIDILNIMIEEGNGEWTVETMADQLATFLLAGHETSAAATTIALYYLCKHEDIQARLRNEIRTHFPDGLASIRTAADVESLKYLNNVVREVLRIIPPVIVSLRMATEDTVLVGQPVPKGTILLLSPTVMNRSTDLWGADADEFNPDRWDGHQATNNMAFMTFFQGPRSCIGRRFAEFEIKALLLAIIGSFRVGMEEGQTVEWKTKVTYRPVGGLPLRLTSLTDW
ncbi:cytochrome P450 [Limtongia smithiae]|uniref:cytochrome P450 n=1 Tax=Limtongia smithiae TaxID=1125753 RepID=UPI0034CFF8CC